MEKNVLYNYEDAEVIGSGETVENDKFVQWINDLTKSLSKGAKKNFVEFIVASNSIEEATAKALAIIGAVKKNKRRVK